MMKAPAVEFLVRSTAFLVTLVVACTGLAPPVAAQLTAQEGVYTAEQAERGHTVYSAKCRECHGADLKTGQGDMAGPPLAGPGFLSAWDGRTAEDLYSIMRQMMPLTAPGTLPGRQYVDLVAYIFSVNEFPAGDEELTNDALATITITGQE